MEKDRITDGRRDGRDLAILSTDGGRSRAVEVAIFLDELWLLGVLAVVGFRLGNGMAESLALAVVLPTVVSVFWAMWLAPRAKWRFPPLAGLTAKLVLLLLAAASLGVIGSVIWAAIFWVASTALVSIDAVRQGQISNVKG